jgi:hypothetical protein
MTAIESFTQARAVIRLYVKVCSIDSLFNVGLIVFQYAVKGVTLLHAGIGTFTAFSALRFALYLVA